MDWTPDILRGLHLTGAVGTALAAAIEFIKRNRRAALAALVGAAVMAIVGITYEGGVRRPEIITAAATGVTGIVAFAASILRRGRNHKQ